MHKKLTAAVVAAAVSLTLSPVANAQLSSSLSSNVGSSQAVTPNARAAKDLDTAVATALDRRGGNRVDDYDDAADSVLEDAVDGKVVWLTDPDVTVEGLYASEIYADGFYHILARVPHSGMNEMVDFFESAEALPDAGMTVPYGLATDADNDWVYMVLSIPIYLV